MRGYQLTEKRKNLQTIAQNDQLRMLLLSISVGAITGLVIAFVRLKLGLSGHKTFMWLTPVLITRLRSGCKIGTAAGGLSTAVTTYSLGANMAGGLIGMPLIVIAGLILDWVISKLQRHKIYGIRMVIILTLAGGLVGLICLAKRMILPAGISATHTLGLSIFWGKMISYLIFGAMAGFVASISSLSAIKKNK